MMMMGRIFIALLFMKCMMHSSALLVYVQSNGQSDQCQNATPCATLSQYANESSHNYFKTNNIHFVFFPGLHYLNKDISFVNVHDVTLTKNGSSTARTNSVEIECQESAGFLFENVADLGLFGLVFTRCSKIHYIRVEPYYMYSHTKTAAALYMRNITNLLLDTVIIQNSSGYGLFLSQVYGLSHIQDCVFQHNSGFNETLGGGNAVLAYQQCEMTDKTRAIVRIERSVFREGMSSTTASGLVITILDCSGVQVDIIDTTMQNNHAGSQNLCTQFSSEHFSGGNMALVILGHRNKALDGTEISIINSTITRGQACFGGGLFLQYHDVHGLFFPADFNVSIANTTFSDNGVWSGGGAVYVQLDSQKAYGYRNINNVLFITGSFFINNRLLTNSNAGAAVMLTSSSFGTEHSLPSVVFNDCHFQHNHINVTVSRSIERMAGAALHISQCLGRILIEDCIFEDNNVTAVAALHSLLTFSGGVTISNNTGFEGGGLALRGASYAVFSSTTNLTLSYNHARFTGGGIFVEEQSVQDSPCFYQVDVGEQAQMSVNEVLAQGNIAVVLLNNTAAYGGSQIYGGRVDSCLLQYTDHNHFSELFTLHNADREDLSVISSEPESLTFCREGVPLDSLNGMNLYHRRFYSGEHFNVSLTLTGQCNGTTPGFVEFVSQDKTSVKVKTEAPSTMKKGCSTYKLTVYTNKSSELLDIRVRDMHHNAIYKPDAEHSTFYVEIFATPLGFMSTSSQPPYKCIENPNISDSGFECTIKKNQSIIKRPHPFWLGYVSYKSSTHESVSGFVVYFSCPESYCKHGYTHIKTDSVTFDQDEQCANNHSGILCGHCKDGLSLSMGSSACLNCTHITVMKTVGISLGLALLGFSLVLVLLVFNLTNNGGTLSGFLFYANMVYIFLAIPHFSSMFNHYMAIVRLKQFFGFVFAFANLILGCNCCFYDGLNVIGRTWIQFILVIYLWSIAGIIIWISRRFAWTNKVIGHNAVHVLATIFLLSHNSTSLAIMHALSKATMEYPAPNNSTHVHRVLLYDGNVHYLAGKHIPLFIVSCIFAVLSASFTFTLLFIQPLQRYSHLKPLRWVNKFKPLFDAYTCPHILKPHCRFWNGYLLLARSILYIIFTTPLGCDYHTKLDALSTTCLIILVTSLIFGGVYTKKHLNIMFSSYLVNLCVLSVMVRVSYTKNTKRVAIVSLISFAIATGTFICTMCYHIYQLVRRSKVIRKIWVVFKRRRRSHGYQIMEPCVGGLSEENFFVTASTSSNVEVPRDASPPLSSTCTHNNYREPQLMDYDSI